MFTLKIDNLHVNTVWEFFIQTGWEFRKIVLQNVWEKGIQSVGKPTIITTKNLNSYISQKARQGFLPFSNVSYLVPLSANSIFGNRKQSQGTSSGEYNG